ncbi:MAG: hypothetical protein LBQ22_02970 [Bacteroidales bacterium]|jgi:hypothetical protein|nr:hypothetical protein [Bacteroidales bacterium]
MDSTHRNIADSEEIVKAIKEALSSKFYTDLIKYCIFYISKTYKTKYDCERGFRGKMAEDYVNETLQSFLESNGRKWYKDKYPNFKEQIISSLQSVLYNDLKSKKELEKTYSTNDDDKIAEYETTIDNNSDEYKETLYLCINILERLGADDDEILLFEPYIIDQMKRQDIEKLYGISASDLTNIKKRLNRKLPLLAKELKNEK